MVCKARLGLHESSNSTRFLVQHEGWILHGGLEAEMPQRHSDFAVMSIICKWTLLCEVGSIIVPHGCSVLRHRKVM